MATEINICHYQTKYTNEISSNFHHHHHHNQQQQHENQITYIHKNNYNNDNNCNELLNEDDNNKKQQTFINYHHKREQIKKFINDLKSDHLNNLIEEKCNLNNIIENDCHLDIKHNNNVININHCVNDEITNTSVHVNEFTIENSQDSELSQNSNTKGKHGKRKLIIDEITETDTDTSNSNNNDDDDDDDDDDEDDSKSSDKHPRRYSSSQPVISKNKKLSLELNYHSDSEISSNNSESLRKRKIYKYGDDKERKENKRDQNKEAAKRYREKKKSEAMKYYNEMLQLEAINKKRREEIYRLERERIKLIEKIKSDHSSSLFII